MRARTDLLARAHSSLALAFHEVSGRSGAGVSILDERIAMYATGHPEAEFYNGVLRLDPRVDPREVIQKADAFFSERARGYTVWVLRGHDADLEQASRGCGLSAGPDMPEMVCERPPRPLSPPANIDLRVVSSDAAARDSNAVMAAAFSTIGVPSDVWAVVWPNAQSLSASHIITVVACEGQRPVAGAMAIIVDDVGEVLNVGTLPSRRRRGFGRLVAHRATGLAFERGAQFTSLQATPFGVSMYRTLGYSTVGHYRWYLRRWQDDRQSRG